jgi:hypothetical protein
LGTRGSGERPVSFLHPSSQALRKGAFIRMMFWLANAVVVVVIFAFAQPVWKSVSVLYLVLVSLYANFATDFTNWQAARVEVKQDRQSGDLEVDVDTAGPTEVKPPDRG